MNTNEKEKAYAEWQNRAFHFYLSARLLYLNQHIVAAAFCSQQSLELILKATLIYHDKSFVPKSANHNFKTLINTLKNKVKNSNHIYIPEYFYYDQQYQSVSRYPSNKDEFFLPENLVDDLDKCFYDLLLLVPYQSDTLLVKTLSPNNERLKKKLNSFRMKNKQIANFRKYVKKHNAGHSGRRGRAARLMPSVGQP